MGYLSATLLEVIRRLERKYRLECFDKFYYQLLE